MPIEVGLSSSQQDSFEQHEELSKLLNETDVFYVPLRNDFGDNNLNTNQDLTKRFDEDLSNKHLIVTFRDIGYSLFLDSVQSIPDANDESKIRVSGKMIVDGICVQFFGCFDHGIDTKRHLDTPTQQINGVGRVELDEEYYRELSSSQVLSESTIKEEKTPVEPIVGRKTRQQTAKLKERRETVTSSNKPKTRSRATSESLVEKNRTSTSTSSPPPLPMPNPLSHSSVSTARPRIHSPSHMPYPLRSPRTRQHRTSPVQYSVSSTIKNPEVHPVIIPTASTAFDEYVQSNPTVSTTTTTTTRTLSSMETSQTPRAPNLLNSSSFSSSTAVPTTIPIQIPPSSNTGLPTTALPQLTNLFPLGQSHSLPTYILPTSNIAYLAAPPSATNPSGAPFDFSQLGGNTGVLLITSGTQNSVQPIHILASIDHRALQFAHFTPAGIIMPPSIPPPTIPTSRTCNILQPASFPESISSVQNKRHENEEDKLNMQQPLQTNKQFSEQLPFKKRRYAGQQLRMSTAHNDDDDVSDESAKK